MKKRFLLLFCTAVLLCGSGCTATQVRDRAYLQAMELQTPQTPTVQLTIFTRRKPPSPGTVQRLQMPSQMPLSLPEKTCFWGIWN